MSLVHISKQWPVGHGGFHTARVTDDVSARSVRYVYDCGSKSVRTVAACVSAYLDGVRRSSGCIDLVILSHVDADHVNGVPNLFAGGVPITRAMMPLLTPIARLLAVARALAEAETFGGEPPNEATLALMIDPIETLRGWSPDTEIVIVTPSGDGGFDVERTPDDPNGPFRFDREGFDLTGPQLAHIGAGGSSRRGNVVTMSDQNGAGVCVPVEGGLGLLWVIAPYVSERIVGLEDEFRHALAIELGFDAAELAAVLNDEMARALVHDERALLSRVFKAVGGADATNASSLCLYAGPPRRESDYSMEVGLSCLVCEEDDHFNSVDGFDGRIVAAGTLLTGDVDLSDAPGVCGIASHYAEFTAHVGTIHVPHHASRHNFSRQAPKSFDQARLAIAMTPRKSPDHPSTSAINAVGANGLLLHLVTDEPMTAVSTFTRLQ